MLSGIKIGKRKKKVVKSGDNDHELSSSTPTLQRHGNSSNATRRDNNDSISSSMNNIIDVKNQSAAEELRRLLNKGMSPIPRTKNVQIGPSRPLRNEGDDDLEKRGRIHPAVETNNNQPSINDEVVIIRNRNIKRSTNNMEASDMTIHDMVKEEHETRHESLAEEEARNVIRLGKRTRNKASSTTVDSDEEVERQKKVITSLQPNSKKQKDIEKHEKREVARHIVLHDRDNNHFTSNKCWWWIEAGETSFQRHRLIAIGNYVTLCMAPIKLSLIPSELFYLVPISHIHSLSSCDDMNIWNEIQYFQNSLRTLFNKENKSIICYETILPNNATQFYQTKLECIVVPNHIVHDGPLYFKTGLQNIAEEYGIHQKLLYTGGIKNNKTLYNTIPSHKNFSYFYVEFNDTTNNNQTSHGFVQMIESNTFPKDFGIDTIAGMMQMDPIQFRSNNKNNNNNNKDEEICIMKQFLEKWKIVDWTHQLD